MASNEDIQREKEYVNVFSRKFTGGPHNLGDPEDKTLRHVEEIFIKKMIYERAHHEKCHEFVQNWCKCMEENDKGWKGMLTFWTCRPQVREMNACLEHYYRSKEYYEEVKNIYLDKRAKYRSTGIIEKDKYDKKKFYETEYSRKFKEYLEVVKKQEQEKGTQAK